MQKRGTEESVATRLFVALVAPLIVLGAMGAFLTLQVVRMERAGQSVGESDRFIGDLEDSLRQIIDQETALRGFLLTEDRVFLEPFERARPAEALQSLRARAADTEQAARIGEASDRYQGWYVLASGVTSSSASPAAFRAAAAMHARKVQMDSVRAAIAAALAAERLRRADLTLTSETAYRTTVFGLAPVSLLLGIGLALISRRQVGGVANTYQAALDRERESRQRVEAQNWARQQHVLLAKSLEGDPSREQLGRALLEILCSSSSAVAGAVYFSEAGGFRRYAGFALSTEARDWFAAGEGLVGSMVSAKSVRVVEDVPAGYLTVRSGTGEGKPSRIVLIPATVDGTLHGLLELAFFGPVEDKVLDLFERATETIGSAMRSVSHRMRLRELLEESQRQTEELQTQQEELETQQEELRVSNEELQQQSDALRLAQALLEERKEELEATNSNLESQRDSLERSQSALEEKTGELSRANRYKSEFLANMSHELRTPLNSALILAKLLADNKQGNLTPEQIQFANTIHSAGNDLLNLINDILDLSKVEAGKIDVHVEEVPIERLLEPLARTMAPVAREKNVAFALQLGEGGGSLETDVQRAHQIILNLLSNAFKFTETGKVTLEVAAEPDRVEITVADTGIGIPKEQQAGIFEAFRQADGTTNRKYGGTGLGLSISRELSRLLGGELRLESEPGKGSRFTLALPREYRGPRSTEPAVPEQVPLRAPRARRGSAAAAPPAAGVVRHPGSGGRLLLVIEDDAPFAEILANLARELEFDCLVAATADEGVRLAFEHAPSAILLDMKLPDHSGLSVLDRLKRNPATRHIPVHVISVDTNVESTLAMGAIGHLTKPVRREDLAAVLQKLKEPFQRLRRVLVVEDDLVQREAIVRLLEAPDLEIVPVATVADALDKLSRGTFDSVVTDLTLPDASGYDLLEKMAADDAYSFPPVIVYTGRDLTRDDEQRLRRYSSSIIVKGARSPERLLDEITLFLHQIEADLPAERQRMLRQVRDREAAFEGRKVLLAEDDVRNIFALSSVLEPRGVRLVIARNGKEALQLLDENEDIDLVLMDLMMPEMDGITAMEEIRKRRDSRAKVPIIALTAKAMRDDQERCLEAGANDYLPKPVDVDVLLSLMRVWMQR